MSEHEVVDPLQHEPHHNKEGHILDPCLLKHLGEGGEVLDGLGGEEEGDVEGEGGGVG